MMSGGANTEGEIVPFDPTDHDVISTKLRSWNLGHPGNLEYANLLLQYARKMPSAGAADYTALQNQYAAEIVNIVVEQRGGRFLKIQEGEVYPAYCTLMDHKASIHKVFHGVKNKHLVILKRGNPPTPTKEQSLKQQQRLRELRSMPRDEPKPPPPPPQPLAPPINKPISKPSKPSSKPGKGTKKAVRPKPKAKAKPAADEVMSATTIGATQSPKRQRRKRQRADDSPNSPANANNKKQQSQPIVRYEAQQGASGQINPYALELISYVCNNHATLDRNSLEAWSSILEEPVSTYIAQQEPEKERRIRLQLRHRIFAAKAMHMPVIEFAKQILQVWGGSLSEVIIDNTANTTKQAEAEPPVMDSTNVEMIQSHQHAMNDAAVTAALNNPLAIGYGMSGAAHNNDSSSTSSDSDNEGACRPRGIPQKEPRAMPQKEPRRAMVGDGGNGGNFPNTPGSMERPTPTHGTSDIARALWSLPVNNDDDENGVAVAGEAENGDGSSSDEDDEEDIDENDTGDHHNHNHVQVQVQGNDSGNESSDAGYGTPNEYAPPHQQIGMIAAQQSIMENGDSDDGEGQRMNQGDFGEHDGMYM